MTRSARSRFALGATLAVGLVGTTWSQAAYRSAPAGATTAPSVSAPAGAAGGVAPGAPAPAGLASPSPFPAGLPSPTPFPAGTPSSVITGPVTGPGVAAPSVPPDTVPPNPAIGRNGGVVVNPARPAVPEPGTAAGPTTGVLGGPGPYTAQQVAQSFIQADANRDGDLTRAEAQQLTIQPFSFEEMDRNRDGLLSRSEYEEALLR